MHLPARSAQQGRATQAGACGRRGDLGGGKGAGGIRLWTRGEDISFVCCKRAEAWRRKAPQATSATRTLPDLAVAWPSTELGRRRLHSTGAACACAIRVSLSLLGFMDEMPLLGTKAPLQKKEMCGRGGGKDASTSGCTAAALRLCSPEIIHQMPQKLLD